ncbi:zincin-like metallopeptidase toxin domain-containing protein [Elizabethkingia meningoseptica]|uniref:zincin-like metallopeptidase toxin domain-containing protein n=1 Tax=Elizabethkingia meningoseptica TaxID=238 RepID=UPI0021A6393B|nr:zincin-like metallopeptidase toxin domain-containing protein [Elizabethkingia meningoseptica]
MFAKGGKKLQDFVEKLWKEIAEWFLKNKNSLQARYEEIADITTKELDWMAPRRIGNLGGNILKETQIRKLRGILKQKGIQLIVDGDTKAIVKLFMPIDNFKSFEELRLFMKNNNKVGLFHAGTKQMILTKNCTEIVAFHEMCHLKHFEEVGEIAYKGYSVVEKEMYVWKQLLSNRRKWTKAELDDSLNYINRERRKAGITEPIKIK